MAPPLPCFIICAISYLRQRKTPVRLMPMVRFQTSTGRSTMLPRGTRTPSGPMPALLNA